MYQHQRGKTYPRKIGMPAKLACSKCGWSDYTLETVINENGEKTRGCPNCETDRYIYSYHE